MWTHLFFEVRISGLLRKNSKVNHLLTSLWRPQWGERITRRPRPIRATFVEETAMDMVLGPFTAAEAASHCHCLVSELCPGPMAAIDEGDRIRTIYDGSWGRANARIQANCAERITAPTVMDCMHGIHWLQCRTG